MFDVLVALDAPLGMPDGGLTYPLLAVIGLSCYALLVVLSAWYARITHWQPPAGNQANDWVLRQRVGIVLGGAALIICALGAALWQVTWQARLLTMLQASLLAAAGASDLQRFHLPLPLTLLGASVAVVTLLLVHVTPYYILFGLL